MQMVALHHASRRRSTSHGETGCRQGAALVAAISRTVLREQVKDVLLQRIVSGELEPGERLVETRIAQELGTSQAPVREALRDLELLRLVESEPFRGSRVRVFGEAEMIEVYPVRAALEELAARLAAENLDGDVSALELEFEAMRDAVRRGDTNALVQHDIAFHRLIVEAAGNSVLEQCWKSLGVEGRITVSLYGTYMDPDAGGRAPRASCSMRSGRGTRRGGARGAEARRGLGQARARPHEARRPMTVVLAVTWVAREGESEAVADTSATADAAVARRAGMSPVRRAPRPGRPRPVLPLRALRGRGGARSARRQRALPGARRRGGAPAPRLASARRVAPARVT